MSPGTCWREGCSCCWSAAAVETKLLLSMPRLQRKLPPSPLGNTALVKVQELVKWGVWCCTGTGTAGAGGGGGVLYLWASYEKKM